jgi:RNA polymerase sigma-70 factor (ECF subfamily)
MSEVELERGDVIRAQKGDRAAFGRLYDALLPGIYGYARSRLPSTADAEDVVSTTFMEIFDSLTNFKWGGSGSMRAWVFRILRNHIADFYRRNGHQEHVRLELAELRGEGGLGDPRQSVERQGLLQDSLSQLSRRQQEVIRLRYFGGLRNKDIARVLGVNERTVAAYLSRGLQALRQRLERLEDSIHAGT